MTADPHAEFTLKSLREKPGLEEQFWSQKQRIWPGFMFEDLVSNKIWHHLGEDFDSYQLYLCDKDDKPVAVCHSIPVEWDGTLEDLPIGWATGFQRGVDGHRLGIVPNTLMALEVAIQPEYQGQGISYRMVKGIRQVAEAHGHQAVIVAVRPSLKSRYPLTPMTRYVRWLRSDGAPFDPWLRVHWRCGGEILKVANPSMVIEAPIADWERWAGLALPENGEYVIDGALAPVEIDRTMDVGRYVEPNVWVHHPLKTERLRGSTD